MLRANSMVQMTVRGQTRNVYLGNQREDGSYSARLRAPVTGNSIRGVVRSTSVGLRFTPSNRSSLSQLS